MKPDQQAVMRQDWHHLLFLHWEIPPSELQKMLPPGLTLDTFDGKAYVGLIPFTMTGVRPILTPPLPGISSFHEVNVRTYVHHEGRDPGVWFFSLDAANRIAVAVARRAFHLPYFRAWIRL
ncbi:MAG: YqjF family protein, partial [Thermoanaerobaculia bacterium]